MPTRDRPDPPADLDRDVRETLARLEERDADRLRAVGRYLEELAAWKESTGDETEDRDEHEREGERESDGVGTDGDAADGSGDDGLEYPEDVPDRATVTVKEIAGTTYHYYQWRDGDRIESKTVQQENGGR